MPTPKVLGALVVACGRAGQLECAMSLFPSARTGHGLPKLGTPLVPQRSRGDQGSAGNSDPALSSQRPAQSSTRGTRQPSPGRAKQRVPGLETRQPSRNSNTGKSSVALEARSRVATIPSAIEGSPALKTSSASGGLEPAQEPDSGAGSGALPASKLAERRFLDSGGTPHAHGKPGLETGAWVPSLDNWHAVLQACISCCSRERALALLPRIRSAGLPPCLPAPRTCVQLFA